MLPKNYVMYQEKKNVKPITVFPFPFPWRIKVMKKNKEMLKTVNLTENKKILRRRGRRKKKKEKKKMLEEES